MHWDHEPIRFGPRAVPARSGRAKTRAWLIFQECWRGPRAAAGDRSRSSGSTGQFTGQWQVHGEPSFASRMHWDHEPTPNPSQEGNWRRRTLAPLLGGVGGGSVHGEPSFAWRMHWGHEPIRFGPRAVPARSGRAKTRAWVIFPGVLARASRCDRGPVAVRY